MTVEQPHAAHGDDHGHGHHGSPFIQHHYDDAQHQFDSGKLGIWLFLAQEVLFFSGLFVAYILYRFHHPEIYSYAHKYLDVKMGAINTAVLIFSSLTAAWAVRAAQLGQRKLLIGCLSVTLLCALTFLGVKYMEYSHKIHEHILFGSRFDPCVSSGGTPLLTKNNECPGHKSSILWDYDSAKPITGCMPAFSVDTDLQQRGIQASCDVTETQIEIKKDRKNNPFVVPAEKPTKTAEKIATQCPPLSLHHEDADGDHPAAEHGEHGEHGSAACWRVAEQPAVCRPGWFFTTRCTGGETFAGAEQALAVALRDKAEADKALAKVTTAKDEARIKAETANVAKAEAALIEAEGIAVLAKACKPTETYWASSAYQDRNECIDGRSAREKAIKKVIQAETDKKVATAAYTITDCVRSEQVGVIVEHHDHEEQPAEIIALATCKGPPKPVDPGDILADRENPLVLGKKAIDPQRPVTAHDEHELEAMGPPPDHTGMFFTIYFAMTGLHGIHVLFGVFVFIWLLIRAVKGQFTPDYFGPVDFAALYWHIVDLIWIFLFPLLYLIH